MTDDHDGYFLPQHEWDSLKHLLQQVGWISDELDTTLVRLSRMSGRQPYRQITEAERPVPFNDKASDLAYDLNGLLNEWVYKVCFARRVDWPGFMRSPKAANWLHNHHVYLALTDGADKFPDDLDAVVKQCRRLIDRPLGTVYAGPCPGSDGEWCGDLYAKPGVDVVKCPRCENVYEVSELRHYMMEEARLTLGTAAELASILPWFMDMPIDRKRINYLARRHLITPRPFADGERFQLGEVVDAHNLLIAHKKGA